MHSSATSTIMCCEFNWDASLVAVGTIDGTVTVSLCCEDSSHRIASSKSHNLLYNFVQIFQCSTGEIVYRLHPGHSMKLPVTSVRFVDRKAEGHESILIASCEISMKFYFIPLSIMHSLHFYCHYILAYSRTECGLTQQYPCSYNCSFRRYWDGLQVACQYRAVFGYNQ